MDTNQSDAWMYSDELPSQTQTNRSSLPMTTTSLPMHTQPLQSRDEIESSIKEFSRLWPSQTQIVHPHTSTGFNDSRNCTIASSGDRKNDNYLKRNGALVSGGVPLAPLTLETEANAWDLTPPSTAENQNRKFICTHVKCQLFWVGKQVNVRLIA